jgi:asparagine synthetase B (glutamine-hydrolysing)
MFAFAVHERDSGRVALARDRFGIKPLYLSQTKARLRFASSLPALLASRDVDTSIDTTALHHYMSFHAVVPAPRTILNGVRKLPPPSSGSSNLTAVIMTANTGTRLSRDRLGTPQCPLRTGGMPSWRRCAKPWTGA